MKDTIVAFAVGAGVVYLAAYTSRYLATPDESGQYPHGPWLKNWGAPLAGGVLLVVAHHLTKGEA
jgi:hypothetical protein